MLSKGNAAAQFNIGGLYENGEGVEQDYAEAARWYRKAADEGYAKAQHKLGYLYDRGLGVKEDSAEALRWYERAAAQGDIEAQIFVGSRYMLGIGVAPSYTEGMHWYRKAADQGNATAETLYRSFEAGGPGDYSLPVAWRRNVKHQRDANAQLKAQTTDLQGAPQDDGYPPHEALRGANAPRLDPANIGRLIDKPDVQGLAAVLDALTPTPITEAARDVALGRDLVQRLIAINTIAFELANGFDPPQGGAIAEAALIVGRAHLADPACDRTLLAQQVASAAENIAIAYSDAGRYEEIIALSDEMETLLAGRTDGQSLASLRLYGIEALIALNRPEEADRALVKLEAAGCTHFKMGAAREHVDEQLRSATALADTRSADRRAQEKYHDAIVGAAKKLRTLLADDPALSPALDAFVSRAEAEKPEPNRADALVEQLAKIDGLEGSELFSWEQRVRKAAGIFEEDSGGRDAHRLAQALQTFRAAIGWFDAHSHREQGNLARWCAFRAERRLDSWGTALDTLEELAARLERDRAGIADRLRRAAQRATFPNLPAAMVECADEICDPRRMLVAIEAAKGRALADLRTVCDNAAFDEAGLHVTPDIAAELVARFGVGYVSYLATEDAVFAVAVWPDGSWHRTRIPMDVKARIALCRQLEPLTWVVPTRPSVFDLGAALAPLVDWLLDLLPTLPLGGHLVLCPDAELHQWPLHMAAMPSGPLGIIVGTSRVHGIDALRRMTFSSPMRPSRAIAVHIPARDESESAAATRAMSRTISMLPNPTVVPSCKADSTFFASLDASDTILHLNAHGVFPEERLAGVINPNPYISAGLLFAHHGELPERNGSWPHRLTPKLVLESHGLKLDRATVVLQGCVSGLAKEGQGGDALGLEWSLLARGAEAVLASHWSVDYRSAGAFCRHFYQAWLRRGFTRIGAWQEALTRTRQDCNGGPPYDWAAFSLSGDWR